MFPLHTAWQSPRQPPSPQRRNQDREWCHIARECTHEVALLNNNPLPNAAAWRGHGGCWAVFIILRPKVLQRLHTLLAGKAVSLSAALHRLGLLKGKLLPGENLQLIKSPAQ
jgi:hypothetical protein